MTQDDPAGPVAPADMRVSNAERDRAAAILEDAVGQGMLTLDEYGERAAIVFAARTRGELGAVLADLPTAQSFAGPAQVSAVLPAPVDGGAPLVLRTGMGTVKQVGQWSVPSRINAKCGSGAMTIDFTTATCGYSRVDLQIECGWGSVLVIVPRSWTVTVDSMRVGGGSCTNKATDPGSPGSPTLVVSGSVTLGSIKIKYSRR